jgi:anti-sigma regulatory factor (Ser/Thr protein kinase)
VERRSLQLEIPLPEDWEAVDLLRASVLGWLRVALRGSPAVEPLAMVAGELLENAVKFGYWKDPARRTLGLAVRGVDDRIEIVVSSPTDLDDPNLRALVAELGRIERAPSAQEAYLDRVRRIALTGKGGLGLARIAHEGGCVLSADVSPDRTLRVKAVTRQPARPTPAAP